jgi:hypothetical protein
LMSTCPITWAGVAAQGDRQSQELSIMTRAGVCWASMGRGGQTAITVQVLEAALL